MNLNIKNFTPRALLHHAGGALTGLAREMRSLRGSNVWTFIMYGLMFDMVNNIWRPFSVKFLERLGGNEFHISLLNSLPGAVGALVLLPGAALFRRFTNKKRATAAFILISRLVLLGMSFVPFLPPAAQPILFVVFVAIMNCPDALSQTSLQSLLGTIFSGSTRGQAIALRTKFGQAIIPIVTVTTGLVITFMPSTDAQRMVLYQIFFAVAFLLGIVEVVIFNKLNVPDEPPAAAQTSGTGIKQVFTDKRFRSFLIPAIGFAFTWQAGWPLFNIYFINVLDTSELWFAIYALASGVGAVFSGTFWQRLLRRRGNSVIFVVAAAMLTLNMIVVPFVPSVGLMAFISLPIGVSTIGITTAMLNGSLEVTPDSGRMLYLACFNTIINISLFVAPFFAVMLFSFFGLLPAMFIVGGLRGVGTLVLFLSFRGRGLRVGD